MKKTLFALPPATVEALLRNLDTVLETIDFGDDAPAFVALQQALEKPLLLSRADELPTAPRLAEPTLYKQFEAVYHEFHKRETGLKGRMDGGQGKALHGIIEALTEHSKTQDGAGALASWRYILGHWARVPPFLQRQKTLTAINKYLVEIIEAIRAATQPKARAWPDAWSEPFASKLTPDELNLYRAHLRSRGWRYDGKRHMWVGPG